MALSLGPKPTIFMLNLSSMQSKAKSFSPIYKNLERLSVWLGSSPKLVKYLLENLP